MRNDFEAALVELEPLIQELMDSANAHDAERHVAAFAHDQESTLIFNGEKFIGWDSIRERQHESWKQGQTDVTYFLDEKPAYQPVAADLIIATLLINSRRPRPDGALEQRGLSFSSVWQKRGEGWRIVFANESIVT